MKLRVSVMCIGVHFSYNIDLEQDKNFSEHIFKIEIVKFIWKEIYFLIWNTTLDTKVRMFQYKILHNILYLNKILFKFGKVISPRCSICKLHEETIMHLFHECLILKRIWYQLKSTLSNNINFPIRTPQSAIFGFWVLDTNKHLILNYLLLIFKKYNYDARNYVKIMQKGEKKSIRNGKMF